MYFARGIEIVDSLTTKSTKAGTEYTKKMRLEKNAAYAAKMPKSVLGLRVGWIDFGRFGGPIDFFHRGCDLLRFFLSPRMECPAWNDHRGT